MWKYISGVLKVIEEEKKEKTWKLPVIQRSTRRTGGESFRQNGKLADRGYSLITIREWFWGRILGEWKLFRASAFWVLLAQMASAIKMCPTWKYQPLIWQVQVQCCKWQIVSLQCILNGIFSLDIVMNSSLRNCGLRLSLCWRGLQSHSQICLRQVDNDSVVQSYLYPLHEYCNSWK